jgi:hypothetical protein
MRLVSLRMKLLMNIHSLECWYGFFCDLCGNARGTLIDREYVWNAFVGSHYIPLRIFAAGQGSKIWTNCCSVNKYPGVSFANRRNAAINLHDASLKHP